MGDQGSGASLVTGSVPWVSLPTLTGSCPCFQASPGTGAESCPIGVGGGLSPCPCPGEGHIGGHKLAACAHRSDGTTRISPGVNSAKIATPVPAHSWGQGGAWGHHGCGGRGTEAELGHGAGQEVARDVVHGSPCSSLHTSRLKQSSAWPQLRRPRAGRQRGRGLGATGTGAGTGVQCPQGARELREPRIALASPWQQHSQVWLHTWVLLNPEGFAIPSQGQVGGGLW